MRLIQDLEGHWLGKPALAAKPPGNRPPIAVADARLAEPDGPTIRIAVLDNDIEPEGEALTLVSAFAALGTAVAEADGTVSYTPPSGIVGADTVVYEVADAQGQTDTGQVDILIAAPALAVEATPDNRLEVTSATGNVDLTISGSGDFDGLATVDAGLLGGGPVNIAPPQIIGDAATEGTLLTAKPGLWAHDAFGLPAQGLQWRRNGVDIPGATAGVYAVTATDVGATLGLTETMTDTLGARSVTIGPTSQVFTPDLDGGLIAWYDAADTATITETSGAVTAWADKAGGGVLSQSSTLRRPVSGTRQLGGLNVLDFDGGDTLDTALTLPVGGDVAFHAVMEIDATDNQYEAVLAIDATRDFQLDAASDTAFNGRLNLSGVGTTISLSGGPFAGPLILSILFDLGAGQAEIFVGGVSRGVTDYTTALDTAQTLRIFTNRSANSWVDGAVAEVVVSSTLGLRQDYHTYLATKWGLS